MKAAEARKLVVEGLAPRFPGFSFSRSKEQFVRKVPGGRQIVFLPFFNYNPDYVYSLTPAVRFDELEHFYCDLHDGRTTESVTALSQLYALEGKPRPEADVPLPNFGNPYFWTFHDMDSLEATLLRVETHVPRVLEFFARLQTLQDAHRFHNIEGADQGVHDPYHRVLVAFFSNNDWRAVAESTRSMVSVLPEYDRAKFEMMISRLEGLR